MSSADIERHNPELYRYQTWCLIREPFNVYRTNMPIYVFFDRDGTIIDWDLAEDCAVRLIQGIWQIP